MNQQAENSCDGGLRAKDLRTTLSGGAGISAALSSQHDDADASELPRGNCNLIRRRNDISLQELAKTFFFIGMTSFGGGLTAYIRRIIVKNKGWLTNEEFFPGLAFCQLLPGANVIGISLYIGNHLRGIPGALVAVFCIIFPPSLIFFGLGYLYFSMGSFPCVEAILKGAGAVACGLMASMFVEAAKESFNNVIDVLIFMVTFLLVRVAHVQVPYVILLVAPLAIWWYRPRA